MGDKFDFKVIEIKRVAKVTEGGKRIKIRSVVVVGNMNGKVGIGIGKGEDIADSVMKGRRLAEKNAISVPIVDGTIPYDFKYKFGATEIILRPIRKGRGIIAGSSVRVVLSLAGYTNISAKIIGVTKNPLVNALAVLKALEMLKKSYDKKLRLINASSSDKFQTQKV